MKLAAVGAVAGAIVLLVAILVTVPRSAPTKTPHLREVASACGPDASTSLSNYFNALAPNSTITLPHNGCFTINTSLHIAGLTGLTLNGNGASLNQAVPGPMSGPIQPILFLTQDTNLKISNLTIDGAFDGTNGGEDYEGNYGISMEGDTNVVLTGITDENIQGDCLLLNAGNDISPSFAALNVGIVMTKSTLNHCGYHGLTLEAAAGFTFAYNTVSNVDLDAIDAEVDGASTYFASGQPQGVAQNNIKILNDTWNNFGDAWYVSLQGQTPGVQQQTVTPLGEQAQLAVESGRQFAVVLRRGRRHRGHDHHQPVLEHLADDDQQHVEVRARQVHRREWQQCHPPRLGERGRHREQRPACLLVRLRLPRLVQHRPHHPQQHLRRGDWGQQLDQPRRHLRHPVWQPLRPRWIISRLGLLI